MITLKQLFNEAVRRLDQAKISNSEREALILIEGLTGFSFLHQITRGETTITRPMEEAVNKALGRRLAGEPAYRILGYREFYGLKFEMNAETLEPRSDTEIVVDVALSWLAKRGKQPTALLDMGTGTGAIALSVLHNAQHVTATAVDIATGALKALRKNAHRLGVAGRVHVLQSNWFSHVSGKYDLIISNPPYIPRADISQLMPEVRLYDPLRALDGGDDGLDFYRLLAEQAHHFLAPDGIIIVEIGYDQKHEVANIFHRSAYRLIDTRKDLNEIVRVLTFARNV